MANQDNNYRQAKSQVQSQVKSLKNNAASQLNDVRDEAASWAGTLQEKAADYADTAKDYADQAGKQLNVSKKMLSKRVSNDPLSALLVAGVAGLVLGMFLKK